MPVPFHCGLCNYKLNLDIINDCPGVEVNSPEELDYGWVIVCPGCSAFIISNNDHTFNELNDEEMWQIQHSRQWPWLETHWQQIRSNIMDQRNRQKDLLEKRKNIKRGLKKPNEDSEQE